MLTNLSLTFSMLALVLPDYPREREEPDLV